MYKGLFVLCEKWMDMEQDELLWGAAWLYYATKMPVYLDFVKGEAKSAQVSEFSWDLKYAGAQVLVYQVMFLFHIICIHLNKNNGVNSSLFLLYIVLNGGGEGFEEIQRGG